MRLLIILSIGWLIVRFRRWPMIMLVVSSIWHLLHLMLDGVTDIYGRAAHFTDVSLFPVIIITFLLDSMIRSATKSK